MTTLFRIDTHARDSIVAALLAMVLAVPFIGLYTVSTDQGLVVQTRWAWVGWAGLAVLAGRFLLGLARDALAARRKSRPGPATGAGAGTKARDALVAKLARGFGFGIALFAVTLPFMPFSDRYIMDLGTTVLIYVLLGMGLNVTVGLAGLLDLGFVAFYAIGAYSFALLSTGLGLGFWTCLPLSGLIAALFGVLLSLPILRLRGDYLAIVTLGFGEITRIVILNWQGFTGGPAGVSGIPRPTLFGMSFDRRPPDGLASFHEVTGIGFSSEHRLIFLYLIALALVLVAAWTINRLRALPVGRAWEALREDEIACRSLGINPTASKVSAYAIGGMLGGFAGCFFAARQGFVSPESFGFIESALILAIVVLGGMGSQIGVVIAALFIVLLPEVGREFADFRMIVFGMAMIAIMVWRPGGLLSQRAPTIRLSSRKGAGA
ncbi:high-affinity branched-chain amino acid ABC transporter permease LivM [Niveispirillum fermenti]|uniref:high-affinity branched-chain amino acid ABC transporter permease LivM n=1 Tax=Niveispirillum fermenti TaxID=1233113 RepID=UPI003A8646D2